MKNKETNTTLLANLMLIVAAIIWGTGSIFQKVASSHVGPMTFYGMRAALGSITLAILVLISEKNKRNKEIKEGIINQPYGKEYFKKLLTTAPICVLANILGNVLVQTGIRYTTASKTGFLTSIYIIFVPILSLIIFKKKVNPLVWIGTLVAVFGLYFLCITDGFTIEKGDAIVLCCTIPLALHIQLVSKYVQVFNPLHFTLTEFVTASIICLTFGLTLEDTDWSAPGEIIPGVLFCGILGIGICYALQSVAQKHTNPTVAALLMSLESVFSAIAGIIFLNESFTGREFLGVVLLCIAIVLAQIPVKNKNIKA